MRNVAAEQGDVRYLCPMKRSRAGSDGRAARCATAISTKKKLTRSSNCIMSIRRSCLCATSAIRRRFAACSVKLGQELFPSSHLTSEKNGKEAKGTDDPVGAPPATRRYLCRVLCRAAARHAEYQESRAHSLALRRRRENPYSVAA